MRPAQSFREDNGTVWGHVTVTFRGCMVTVPALRGVDGWKAFPFPAHWLDPETGESFKRTMPPGYVLPDGALAALAATTPGPPPPGGLP